MGGSDNRHVLWKFWRLNGFLCHMIFITLIMSASGRGARESACAGLINQLQCCRFDSRIACLKNTDTAIVGDCWTGVGGHHALNC